jgi:carbon storage regulator
VLVLTRRIGESITIGDDVVVTVLEVRGGQVRLGIEAPPEVTLVRSEILDQIAEQTPQMVKSTEAGTMVPKVTIPTDPGEA